jgi:hypothetical protein
VCEMSLSAQLDRVNVEYPLSEFGITHSSVFATRNSGILTQPCRQHKPPTPFLAGITLITFDRFGVASAVSAARPATTPPCAGSVRAYRYRGAPACITCCRWGSSSCSR